MSKAKLIFIDYAYIIGSILVVLGHSTPTGSSDMPIIMDMARAFIYSFHMPLFFFIAGFLLKYTKGESRGLYSQFIKKKAYKFLTPYVVLSVVFIVPKILLSAYTSDNVSFSLEYLLRTIFSPRDNVWGHFWFLPTLFIMYIFSYILLFLCKKKIVALVLVLTSIIFAVFPIQTDWFAIKDICEMLIFFLLGILTCKYIVNNRDFIFKPSTSIVLLSISIVIFVLYINLVYNNVGYTGTAYQVTKLIVGILMIYVVLYFSILLSKLDCKFLCFLEGKTFSIYIISWPCQAVAEILANRILHLHWYFVMLIMFIAGLGIPLLANVIYKRIKWHPKFINLVFGFNNK